MNQRRFLVLALGASFASHATLLRAQTSSSSMRRVGVFAPSTRAKEEVTLKPFFDQMRQLGWVEGQNIVYDRVYADDQRERLPKLATELVARKPEVIYAPPSSTALAAKQATQTIPIVFSFAIDPVGTGLVKGFARPGGNVTGLSSFVESLTAKRIQLLREILPVVQRIGLLGDTTDPSTRIEQQQLAPVAASMGLTIIFAEAANPADFDAAMARLVAQRVEAIFQAGVTPLVYNMRGRLIELANMNRVAFVAGSAPYADSGALFTTPTRSLVGCAARRR
jgi:putative ABC transport system substrate-binding protein